MKEEITLGTVEKKMGKAFKGLRFLLESLYEVLIENGEEDIAKSIPWINHDHFQDISITPKTIQLYSLVLQLKILSLPELMVCGLRISKL